MINHKLWEKLLSSTLPGKQAQFMMAPTFRGDFTHTSDPIPAAVLILMYPSNGQTNIVFIKRNAYDGPHSAQVSFPGGAWEAADGSLENTSIRETREELGVQEDIEILGKLTELHIPVSNFLVSPYVASTPKRPEFSPDITEVQYIIETPLKDLLDPRNLDSEKLHRHSMSIEAPFYKAGDEKIWGATAMILSEFLQLASMLQ